MEEHRISGWKSEFLREFLPLLGIPEFQYQEGKPPPHLGGGNRPQCAAGGRGHPEPGRKMASALRVPHPGRRSGAPLRKTVFLAVEAAFGSTGEMAVERCMGWAAQSGPGVIGAETRLAARGCMLAVSLPSAGANRTWPSVLCPRVHPSLCSQCGGSGTGCRLSQTREAQPRSGKRKGRAAHLCTTEAGRWRRGRQTTAQCEQRRCSTAARCAPARWTESRRSRSRARRRATQ